MESDFLADLFNAVKEEVEKETLDHTLAAERVHEALITYRGAIDTTVKARIMARVRRLADPPSNIEDAALRLIAAVEELPEFGVIHRHPPLSHKQEPSAAKPAESLYSEAPRSTPNIAPAQTPEPAPTPESAPAPVTVSAQTPAPATPSRPTHPHGPRQKTFQKWPRKEAATEKRDPANGAPTKTASEETPRASDPEKAVAEKIVNVVAHAENRPLQLVGGVPEPKKIQMLERLGIHAEWEARPQRSLKNIRGGRASGVIVFIGYTSHEISQSVMTACRETHTPCRQVNKMGDGEIRLALEEIDKQILKKELVG